MTDLFEYRQPQPSYGTEQHKLRRNEDPGTSHETAEKVNSTRLERMVHRAIADSGARGATASDLLRRFPAHAYSSITARFSALERKGLISCGPDKRQGASSRQQRVMRSLVEPSA